MNLTTQQLLALEQTRNLYSNVDRTGEHLDDKANAIIQSGALIVAVVGATTLPAIVGTNTSPVMLAAVGAAFLLFIMMICCAIAAWRPTDHEYPGPDTWDRIFDNYISRDKDDAYNQVLKNLVDAIEINRAANRRKVHYVSIAAWLLALQVAGILVLAILATLMTLA